MDAAGYRIRGCACCGADSTRENDPGAPRNVRFGSLTGQVRQRKARHRGSGSVAEFGVGAAKPAGYPLTGCSTRNSGGGSIRQVLEILDFCLGFEAVRYSHESLEDFAAWHDSDAPESLDAALRLITRHRRGKLQKALSAFFGSRTGLLWALYSAIKPRFFRRHWEVCNDLVTLNPGCNEEPPDVLRMWQFVSGDGGTYDRPRTAYCIQEHPDLPFARPVLACFRQLL